MRAQNDEDEWPWGTLRENRTNSFVQKEMADEGEPDIFKIHKKQNQPRKGSGEELSWKWMSARI